MLCLSFHDRLAISLFICNVFQSLVAFPLGLIFVAVCCSRSKAKQIICYCDMSCTSTVNQMFVNWGLKECLGSHWNLPVVTQSSQSSQSSHGDLLTTSLRWSEQSRETTQWSLKHSWLSLCLPHHLWFVGLVVFSSFAYALFPILANHSSHYASHTFLLLSQDIWPFRSNDSDNDCNTEDARGSLKGPTVPGIAVQTGVKVAPASVLGRSSDGLDKKAYIVQDGRDTSAVGLVLFSIYLW